MSESRQKCEIDCDRCPPGYDVIWFSTPHKCKYPGCKEDLCPRHLKKDSVCRAHELEYKEKEAKSNKKEWLRRDADISKQRRARLQTDRKEAKLTNAAAKYAAYLTRTDASRVRFHHAHGPTELPDKAESFDAVDDAVVKEACWYLRTRCYNFSDSHVSEIKIIREENGGGDFSLQIPSVLEYQKGTGPWLQEWSKYAEPILKGKFKGVVGEQVPIFYE